MSYWKLEIFFWQPSVIKINKRTLIFWESGTKFPPCFTQRGPSWTHWVQFWGVSVRITCVSSVLRSLQDEPFTEVKSKAGSSDKGQSGAAAATLIVRLTVALIHPNESIHYSELWNSCKTSDTTEDYRLLTYPETPLSSRMEAYG